MGPATWGISYIEMYGVPPSHKFPCYHLPVFTDSFSAKTMEFYIELYNLSRLLKTALETGLARFTRL